MVFQPCGALPSVLDVFTDGSCLFPTCPSLRVASWAVVLGLPFRLDFSALDFQPLAGQPLPGLVQTAYRAELYAIMTALKFAVKVKRGIRIWTDCQSALDAFASHVRDGIPVRANSKHCDLLFAIQRLASEVGFGCVEVLKVLHTLRKKPLTMILSAGWFVAMELLIGWQRQPTRRGTQPPGHCGRPFRSSLNCAKSRPR